MVLHWRPSQGIQSAPPAYRWRGEKLNAGWVTTFNEYAVVSENRLTVIPADYDLKVAPLYVCAVTTAAGFDAAGAWTRAAVAACAISTAAPAMAIAAVARRFVIGSPACSLGQPGIGRHVCLTAFASATLVRTELQLSARESG